MSNLSRSALTGFKRNTRYKGVLQNRDLIGVNFVYKEKPAAIQPI